MMPRDAVALACALALVVGSGCRRDRDMVWSRDPDGFESSYFREPNGPTYVSRKRLVDACIFRDYPELSLPRDVRVACGAMWTGTYGHQLRCECADAGE